MRYVHLPTPITHLCFALLCFVVTRTVRSPIYRSAERMFPGTKVPGNFRSRERMFPLGTLTPSLEQKYRGAKRPRTVLNPHEQQCLVPNHSTNSHCNSNPIHNFIPNIKCLLSSTNVSFPPTTILGCPIMSIML